MRPPLLLTKPDQLLPVCLSLLLSMWGQLLPIYLLQVSKPNQLLPIHLPLLSKSNHLSPGLRLCLPLPSLPHPLHLPSLLHLPAASIPNPLAPLNSPCRPLHLHLPRPVSIQASPHFSRRQPWWRPLGSAKWERLPRVWLRRVWHQSNVPPQQPLRPPPPFLRVFIPIATTPPA